MNRKKIIFLFMVIFAVEFGFVRSKLALNG
jgi:hypothetical protein